MNSSLISFLAYLIRNGNGKTVTNALRCGAVTPAEVMAATKMARV